MTLATALIRKFCSTFDGRIKQSIKVRKGCSVGLLTCVLSAAINTATPSQSFAATACESLNSTWGAGATYSNEDDLYLTGLNFNAGDKISYQVSTNGNTNDYTNNKFSGGGFAIYADNETTILYEEYAGAGSELSLSTSLTIPNPPRNSYTLYPWSGNSNGTTTIQATCVAAAPAPTLDTVSPNVGSTTGGTTVVLTGSDFTGATQVHFGSNPASSFTVNSSTQITAVTPPGTVVAVNVSVTNTTGIGSISGGFTYRSNPTITSVAVPANGTYTIGNELYFTANFDAVVTVSGTPSLGLMVGSSSKSATYVSGSGSTALTFRYTVEVADNDADGISVNALVLNGGTIRDNLDLDAALNLQSIGSTASVLIDGVRPTVNSITLNGTPAADAVSLDYGVEFSESVSGVSVGDFSLTTTGTASGVISGISGSGATYTVGISSITGTGTIRLDLQSSGTSILDASGNAIATGFLGANHTVAQSTVPGAPVIGDATAGDTQASVTFSSPLSDGGAPITGYTVTSSPGGITGTATTSPITVAGLSNGTTYTFSVTAANSKGTSAPSAASNSVTPASNQIIAFVNPGAQNFGTSPILTATSDSGLTPTFTSSSTSVCTISSAGLLTFVAAGTCTVSADQVGNAAFLPASRVTQSFTVNAVVPGVPTIGTATGGDEQATVAFTIPSSNGGSAITGYTVVSNPGGLQASGSSSPIIVTGLTNGTAYTFTVSAANTLGAGTSSGASNSVTPTAALAVPVAGVASGTVPANSLNNSITLNLSGGAATSVDVVSGASHGTAATSGTSITYSPEAGYSGSDTFTYTATNIAGTSPPATVTVTVLPPVLNISPTTGSLPDATVASNYSQSLSATAGTSPYEYVVTAGALPAGVNLGLTSGLISGRPTTAGNASFTVTVTDANGAMGSSTYSMALKPATVTFVFTPSAGELPEAMAGENYSQSLTANGGSGALIYSLTSGSLPVGMVLNVSTGELTGPLDDATDGSYSFTIQVRDGSGATGSAAYTLNVKPRNVTVTDKVVNVPAGSTPTDVYLNRGATGGPFTSADLTFVEPPNAGTATLIQGSLAQVGPVAPVGWYLQFTPNPAYSGQVRVGFRLTSALGVSNSGTVTYILGYDPAAVAQDVDRMVHGFVQSRQNMISSSIKVPGLLERRQMEKATSPVNGQMVPSEHGMTLGFSTSLAQLEASRNSADGAASGYSSLFNIWIDGAFLAHNDNDTDSSKWGTFAMVNLGVDYLLSDKALVGVSLHYDRMTDPTDDDAELKGNGWLAGPYASFEVTEGIFWNASLLYGGSTNDIDTQFWDGTFDTKRLMMDTSLEGQFSLDAETVLTPKLRAVYFSESVEDYRISNDAGDIIELEGFDEKQFRVSLGAEISRSFSLSSGATLTPKLGATGGYSGLDGAGAFGSLKAGVSLETTELWMLDASLLFNADGDGETSVGAKVGANKRF